MVNQIRRRRAVPKAEVIARFATAPVIDVGEFRADLADVILDEIYDPYEGTSRMGASVSGYGKVANGLGAVAQPVRAADS